MVSFIIIFEQLELLFVFRKGVFVMTGKEKLEKFVLSLTDEQVEKLISRLELLSALLEEQAPPYLPEQTLQNPKALS